MTKSQFLQSLETELKSRRLRDAGEILEEYEQHFSFKLADGYTEQEIARKLGSPFSKSPLQFDPQSPKREALGGRSAIIAGLCLASVPTAGFFLLLAGWEIIVACFSLVESGNSNMPAERDFALGPASSDAGRHCPPYTA